MTALLDAIDLMSPMLTPPQYCQLARDPIEHPRSNMHESVTLRLTENSRPSTSAALTAAAADIISGSSTLTSAEQCAVSDAAGDSDRPAPGGRGSCRLVGPFSPHGVGRGRRPLQAAHVDSCLCKTTWNLDDPHAPMELRPRLAAQHLSLNSHLGSSPSGVLCVDGARVVFWCLVTFMPDASGAVQRCNIIIWWAGQDRNHQWATFCLVASRSRLDDRLLVTSASRSFRRYPRKRSTRRYRPTQNNVLQTVNRVEDADRYS